MFAPSIHSYNQVRPHRAIVRNNRSGEYELTIYGIDSFDEEITVAEYFNFPTAACADEKAREWVIPKSKTVYEILEKDPFSRNNWWDQSVTGFFSRGVSHESLRKVDPLRRRGDSPFRRFWKKLMVRFFRLHISDSLEYNRAGTMT